MAETDAQRSLLLNALGFREARVEDSAAARRGFLEAESARQEPGIDFEFDRQQRAIELAREDQGLLRSGFTGTLLGENEFLRNQAGGDLAAQTTASQFDIFDSTQRALDEIEMQRIQAQLDFFNRDLNAALRAGRELPSLMPSQPVDPYAELLERFPNTRTTPRTGSR